MESSFKAVYWGDKSEIHQLKDQSHMKNVYLRDVLVCSRGFIFMSFQTGWSYLLWYLVKQNCSIWGNVNSSCTDESSWICFLFFLIGFRDFLKMFTEFYDRFVWHLTYNRLFKLISGGDLGGWNVSGIISYVNFFFFNKNFIRIKVVAFIVFQKM